MLKKWDLVHPTFPHETIKSYVKRQIEIRKVASIFDKSPVPSKVRVSEVPTECELLRKKILAKHQEIFKEKIGKNGRVNIPPVKLQLKDKDVQPVNVGKCFDVPYHLRRPAIKEFKAMVDAGIVVPHDEPSEWRSQAFPRMKPGSDPPKARWVTDFCKLNACLKRPIWGAESSSQVLLHEVLCLL